MIPPTGQHHVQAIPNSGTIVSEDSEDFLILDEEENEGSSAEKPRSKISLPKISIPRRSTLRKTPKDVTERPNQTEENGFAISFEGTHHFDWGIRGMDCPDCAMKATRAVKRLPGVESCRISVSDGTVEISQDISSGSISRASSVLSSLGHEPDVEWFRAVGSSTEARCLELGVDENGLKNWILNVPGVLDTRMDMNRIDIQRVRIIDSELSQVSEQKLSEILGQGHRLEPTRESGFRKDQLQLLSSILSIPLIFLVSFSEKSDFFPEAVPWILALGGIFFAGQHLHRSDVPCQACILGTNIFNSRIRGWGVDHN